MADNPYDVPLPGLSDAFFSALIPMAQRIGTKPEDLIVVFAGESGLNPAQGTPPAGSDNAGGKGLSAITRDVASVAGLTDDQWKAFHLLSAEQQLPYIETYFAKILASFGLKGYRNALELYLANAASTVFGNYRTKGVSPTDVLYSGAGWRGNLGMDNYPILANKYGNAIQAFRVANNVSYGVAQEAIAQKALAAGDLKGYVSYADFLNYAKASVTRSNWRDGIARLRDIQQIAATDPRYGYTPVSYTPSGTDPYTPDFQLLNPDGTPVKMPPAVQAPIQKPNPNWVADLLVVGVIGAAGWALWRFVIKKAIA
jgi:hypothetical protein